MSFPRGARKAKLPRKVVSGGPWRCAGVVEEPRVSRGPWKCVERLWEGPPELSNKQPCAGLPSKGRLMLP